MNAKPTNSSSTDNDVAPSLRDRASDAYDGARERAIEAYDNARERAAEAGEKARDGIGQSPLIALGGGLALGALLAAFLPKTRTEDRLLGRYGEMITGGAKAAAEAASEAGRETRSSPQPPYRQRRGFPGPSRTPRLFGTATAAAAGASADRR